MKSILISIRPEWTAKILSGEKTIEIRKTAPRCDLPIEVYIYCTKGKSILFMDDDAFGDISIEPRRPNRRGCVMNGKVVAKFTLRDVERIYEVGADEDLCVNIFATNKMEYYELLNKSCLKEAEMNEYLTSDKEFVGYAYHISDLVIFDEPKELSEFKVLDETFCYLPTGATVRTYKAIKRAPQSWQYVEKTK